jgi:2-C-methyl-D-erythritol 4-phosphate cytidylyltransferase
MAGVDKVWADLAGVPLFLHSVRAFDGPAQRMTLVVRDEDVNRARDVLRQHAVMARVCVVAGGLRRQDSVRHGLESTGEVDLVAIHDAARPLVSRELIARVTEAAIGAGAAVPALPVADTLKRVAGSRIEETVDRANLWAVQTPQTFSRALAVEAHSYAYEHGVEATDDAYLVEALGQSVAIVEGSPWNIKVTGPGDLARARAMYFIFCTERVQDT